MRERWWFGGRSARLLFGIWNQSAVCAGEVDIRCERGQCANMALTFFARQISPTSNSFFFLFPLSAATVEADALPENVRSTSHTLTSTSLPARAKVVESGPGDEIASKGEGTVRLDEAADPVGWKVSRPDVRAEMVPLYISYAYESGEDDVPVD